MLKSIIIFPIFILITATSYSQSVSQSESKFTYENFNSQILEYKPIQRDGVSEKEFNYGMRIFGDVKSSTGRNSQNLNLADYWNITMAFLNFNEPKEHIAIAFKKAIESDYQDLCVYVSSMGVGDLDKLIPEIYYPFYEKCLQLEVQDSDFDPTKYAKENNLNLQLVETINQIHLNDVKFRGKNSNPVKQNPLDKKNQKLIDSLFEFHNTYIGKSLVGAKLNFVMWAVIQHSNVDMMGRYLPVVQDAVKNNELELTPFRMLIDRYYGLKYGYQVFGTQTGFGWDLANEKTRKDVIKKFNL